MEETEKNIDVFVKEMQEKFESQFPDLKDSFHTIVAFENFWGVMRSGASLTHPRPSGRKTETCTKCGDLKLLSK